MEGAGREVRVWECEGCGSLRDGGCRERGEGVGV